MCRFVGLTVCAEKKEMITLAKKIKEEKEKKEKGQGAADSAKTSRVSVRDKLLAKGS